MGYSLQAVYIAHIIIDNECDCNEKVPPSYRLYANGTNDKDLQVILDKAIQKFIKEGNYFFIIIVINWNVNFQGLLMST